ncbi:MAG: hypothetical protein K0R98_1255 [Rickettsiaceae bacterium]|jgi:hypothetical protein|nr:hypothetical protein [Rickettsiaceae bacterium]
MINRLLIVTVLILVSACATPLPTGKNIPTEVSGITLDIKEFDGSLMNQPVGAKRLNGSNFIFWKHRAASDTLGTSFGLLGALVDSGIQNGLNSKLIEGKTANFDTIKFKEITDEIIQAKYVNTVKKLKGNGSKIGQVDISTYCSIKHEDTDEDEITATYLTDIIIKLDGKDIWRTAYRAPSKYKTLADLSASSANLKNDVKDALELNLKLFFADVSQSGIATK